MAAAHNTFIQGLNAIIHHAPNVPSSKIQPFLIFCLALIDQIHHHHTLEETYAFPEFEARLGKDALSANVHQHEEFVPQVEAFEEHLKSIQDGKEEYNGQGIVDRINEFGDVLVGHLKDEINTLDATKFKAAFTEAELKAIDAELVKRALSGADFYKMLPLSLVCANPATPWFPPIPTPVRWAARWWYSRRYSESWEFGPVDLAGNVRNWG